MSGSLLRATFFATLCLFIAGCASVPGDAGFHQVQEAVRARSGFQASWEQVPDGGPPLEERLHALLQKELSDRDAVDVALLNNRRLQAALEELGLARADLMQAGLIRNPLLFGEIRFPDRPFEITLTQPLLDLFRLKRNLQLSAAALEAAKLRVGDEVLKLIAQVRSTFFALQGAEQRAAMRRTIVDAARATAELAIRQREAGNISPLGLETEQALLEQAKLELASSETEALGLRERLTTLMGLWGPDTVWKIAVQLPQLPQAEETPEGLESLAVSQRLDLAAARQEVEVAARALPLARSGAIGDYAVGGHLEREPEGLNTTGPAIEVPIPLFNRGKAARARAEALLRQSQERFAALAVEVRSEVRAARTRLLAARSRVEYYRDVILPRRSRIVALTLQQYNFMLSSPFQLVQSRQSETTAQAEYIDAQRDYWIARAELDRAAGGSLASVPSNVLPVEPEGESREKQAPGESPQGGDQQ